MCTVLFPVDTVNRPGKYQKERKYVDPEYLGQEYYQTLSI
jgi:hypothetical protein